MPPRIKVKGKFLKDLRLNIKIAWYGIFSADWKAIIRSAEPVVKILNGIKKVVENPIVDLSVSAIVKATPTPWDDKVWQAVKKGIVVFGQRDAGFQQVYDCFRRFPDDDDALVRCLVSHLQKMPKEKVNKYLKEIAFWTLDHMQITDKNRSSMIFDAIEEIVKKAEE